jgi:hypothetical protein
VNFWEGGPKGEFMDGNGGEIRTTGKEDNTAIAISCGAFHGVK